MVFGAICNPASGPTLGVTMTHTGNAVQGGTFNYTITPSATVANTSGTLTATWTLPAGLTYNAASGTGWSCSASGCTSTSVITAGSNGNPIALTVNVASNAGSPLTPSVTLSGGGASASATGSDSGTTVNPAAPVAGSVTATVAFNSTNNPISLNLSGGTAASVAVSTPASHGTATASGTSITYTPAAGYSGTDSFQYTATNTGGTSAPATVTITVKPAAPVAGPVTATVAFNSTNNPISLNLSGGTAASVAVSTPASHGTATASGTSITYTPAAGYSGSDTFQYTATNAGGTSAPATVMIKVKSVPAPVAGPVTATAAFNSTNNPISLNLSGGAATSVAVSTPASHGTATASGTSITYTPAAGYSGMDSFQYTATNAGGTSAPATVTITVKPGAPLAGPVTATVAFNSTNNPISLNLSGGTAASVAVSTPASHGTATASGTSITYTPATGYSGTDSFQYTATNTGGTSAPATVTITVKPAAPVAGPVTATVAFNSTNNPISLNLSGGTAASVAVSTPASHGTATAAGTSITYTPAAGYSGTDSFQYTATNTGGTSAPATVTITVKSGSPTVTSISPNTGPARGGTSVTITGTNFTGATAVKFGVANATSFSVISATTIIAISPAGALGTVSVAVTTAAGTSATGPTDQFTYAVPAGSLKLHTLEVAGTATVSTISGQVITGQVADAIGDAFSTGAAPITPGPNGMHFNFAAEPQRDAATQEAQDAVNALAYAGGVYKAPPLAPSLWSAWADVRGTGFDQNNALSQEQQINVTGGIGYKLSPNLLVGVFTGYENFNFTMQSVAGKLTGDGGTVGGYAAWRFTDRWRLDGMLGWSDILYDGSAAGASGSFTGSRWLGSGGFTGNYNWDGFAHEPSVRIYTLWESDSAYNNSLGTAQAANSFSESRASTGDKISYPWQVSPALRIAPYGGLYADFRFSTNTGLPVGVPFVGIEDGWSGRVTAGVSMNFANGATATFGGELGGLGSDYYIWSANARLNWRFSVLAGSAAAATRTKVLRVQLPHDARGRMKHA